MRLTTIILIILFIVVTALSCFAQKGTFSAISFHDTIKSNGHTKLKWRVSFQNVFDSTSMSLKLDYNNISIYGDTVAIIRDLSRWLNDKQSEVQETKDALYEAENILRWIRTDGFVTNWKEFRKATDRYIKIRDYKAVIKKP